MPQILCLATIQACGGDTPCILHLDRRERLGNEQEDEIIGGGPLAPETAPTRQCDCRTKMAWRPSTGSPTPAREPARRKLRDGRASRGIVVDPRAGFGAPPLPRRRRNSVARPIPSTSNAPILARIMNIGWRADRRARQASVRSIAENLSRQIGSSLGGVISNWFCQDHLILPATQPETAARVLQYLGGVAPDPNTFGAGKIIVEEYNLPAMVFREKRAQRINLVP